MHRLACLPVLFAALPVQAAGRVSPATQACLDCHADATPGVVADWQASRHAATTVAEALGVAPASRRVSVAAAPDGAAAFVVGCAECHAVDPADHADTWDHEGHKVHIVVSPRDCARCHPVEEGQFRDNVMSRAYGNLVGNPLYGDLVLHAIGPQAFDGRGLVASAPAARTASDACLSCHGTEVRVTGKATRKTEQGDMEFPVLSGWANGGVGRVNPDGSKGACTACHPRHRFSLEVARKPETCSTCHKGPDVPAFPVFEVSKHGVLRRTLGDRWDWNALPWVAGRDFAGPTCASCHVAPVVSPGGAVAVERTHRMADRLPWRLFGLPYAHAHPESADTTGLRDPAGLPLPTGLDGTPAAKGLIGAPEQAAREGRMRAVCGSCHAGGWVEAHFAELHEATRTTNDLTLQSTKVLQAAWAKGLATGPAKGGSPFDEAIERTWVQQWLFYANSTRFAAAMAGADYGTFANGRWQLAAGLRQMVDWLSARSK